MQLDDRAVVLCVFAAVRHEKATCQDRKCPLSWWGGRILTGGLFVPKPASGRAATAAVSLTWEVTSIDIHWYPLVARRRFARRLPVPGGDKRKGKERPLPATFNV